MRRFGIRLPVTLAVTACLIFTTAAFDKSCGKHSDGTPKTPAEVKVEYLAYATDIEDAFTDAAPLVISLKPSIETVYNQGLSIARQLHKAIADNDETEAARLVVALVPIFNNQIVPQFVHDTRVLAILTLANIGLRFFANHYLDDILSSGGGQGAAAGNAQIRAFAKKKNWRCRNAQTGRFAEMDFCKAHPDISIVETY